MKTHGAETHRGPNSTETQQRVLIDFLNHKALFWINDVSSTVPPNISVLFQRRCLAIDRFREFLDFDSSWKAFTLSDLS